MKSSIVKDYGWILRGKQRRIILKNLNKPKTPTIIKEETKIKVSNVSDVLRAMKKRKIAQCLNPKDKLGRLYELTSKGKSLLRELEK